MELPETDASEYDDENIRQMLIEFAPDMYTDTRNEKRWQSQESWRRRHGSWWYGKRL